MKQVAINDIGTPEDFLAAIDGSIKKFSHGQAVSGVVVQVDYEGVLVDIGAKSEAFIPKKEISELDEDGTAVWPEVGQTIQGHIVHIDQEGNYTLSLKEGKTKKLWDELKNKFETSDPVTGRVKKQVKGGLIVDIGVRAFLPGSLIEIQRVDNFESYIGKDIEAIILQIDVEKQNIVLSRKGLLEKTVKEDTQIQFAKLAVGQEHIGKVSGISKYGTFVKIGLVSGLIHKSKMGGYMPDYFTSGQDIKVEILDIDFENSRLSLSFKG